MDLRVPWALNPTGDPVWPADGTAGATYSCPHCGGPLVWKREHVRGESTAVRAHFAHHPDAACATESDRHLHGKLTLLGLIRTGAGVVRLPCGHEWALGDLFPIRRAELEVTVGPYRVDVGVLGEDGAVVAALEVRVTHAVPEEKARALAMAGELLEVVDWADGRVTVVRHSYYCLQCERRALSQERAGFAAERSRQEVEWAAARARIQADRLEVEAAREALEASLVRHTINLRSALCDVLASECRECVRLNGGHRD